MKKLSLLILLFGFAVYPIDFKANSFYLEGFGSNYMGTLSTGKPINYDYPIQTLNISNAVKITCGYRFTFALLSDGTVWAWGKNEHGELGNNMSFKITEHDSSLPVQVMARVWNGNSSYYYEPLKDVIDIDAGGYHTLALKSDGSVWGWGYNAFYQILGGLGKYVGCAEKIYFPENVKIVKISAGGFHSLAIDENGYVWAWGYNCSGQLGAPSDQVDGYEPYKIKKLKNVKDISAGRLFSLALTSDGSIWIWGGLGMENEIRRVKGMPKIVKIESGADFFIAVDVGGFVWAMGYNGEGELGNGTTENSIDKPIKIETISNVVEISAGFFNSIAREWNGSLWTWGWYSGYATENGGYEIIKSPIKIEGISDVIKMAVGKYHQIFLKNDGTVWGRMDNYYGQLGIGEFGYEPSPVPTKAPFNLVQIDGGYLFSMALKEDGSVWSWGYNYFGQLGTGKTKDEILYSLLPVQVQIEAVKQIGAGSEFGVALKEDGSVWTWGSNEYGQLGDGTGKNSEVPIKVMEGVKSIAAGNFHCLAIKEDGSVWQWGWPHSRVPEKVSNLKNVIAVSGGKEHSIALKEDGTVWAWGWNRYGQLGNGKTDINYYSIPQKVLNLENVVAISAGAYHNLAIKEDGTVWFWGWRQEKDKQYGWINDIFETVPVQIQNIPPVSSASACNFFSLLVDFEGNLWTWGLNEDGQVGIGYSSNYPVEEPVKIIDTKDVISSGCGSFHSFAIKKIDLKKFLIKKKTNL